jgi:hypothetical protein
MNRDPAERARAGRRHRVDIVGWLMWNTMRLAAALGFVLFMTTIVLFIWFMFHVGFAWVSFVLIGLIFLLLFFSVKNRRTGFDIRR